MKKALSIALGSILLVGLTGCDVDKTKEGNVTIPKYEVTKTQEGSVTAPQYDVTPPQVSVGTDQKTVVVPTVKTEERQITVPTVDVKPAPDK